MKDRKKTNFLQLYSLKAIKLCTIALIAFAFAACAASSGGSDPSSGGSDPSSGGSDPSSGNGAVSCQADTQQKCAFISVWNTANTGESTSASSATSIKLPLVANGMYDFMVDWGDGNVDTIKAYDAATHDYGAGNGGEKTITITGTIEGWRFGGDVDTDNKDYGDAEKLLNVEQWGLLSLGDTDGYQFYKTYNFNPIATDAPDLSTTTDLSHAFDNAKIFDANINHWDVSNIFDFSYTFDGATSFNQPLNDWGVSNATSFEGMFKNASDFNQPLNDWDVSNATSFEGMFYNAQDFSQPLNDWDVGNAANFKKMFHFAKDFNQPLNDWDVSNAINFSDMFSYAESFNGNISGWAGKLSKVEDMSNMFRFAEIFDQDLSSWTFPAGVARAGFDVGSLVWSLDRRPKFYLWGCEENKTGYESCFVSKWDTTKTSGNDRSDAYQTDANQIKLPLVTGHRGQNSIYNFTVYWGDGSADIIKAYEDPAVTHTYATPGEYTVYITGEIRGWAFANPGFPSDVGDVAKLLEVSQWGSLDIGETYGSQFKDAVNLNITATDAPALTDTSSLAYAFSGATVLEGNFSSWDVSEVVSLPNMFSGAINFNADISSWDVSRVDDLASMFRGAINFNADISRWDVSRVDDITNMFDGAKTFNQDLSSWTFPSDITGFDTYDRDADAWDEDNKPTFIK